MSKMCRKINLLGLFIAMSLFLWPLAATAEQGVFVIGFDAGDTMGWDPWRQAPTTPDKFTCAMLYSGLVRFKPGDINPANIEPDLAEKWESSSDGLTWTFYLRKGVQWHRNYGEVTSEDVVYSLTHARDNSFARKDFASFKEIKALDKYTVQIVLSQPVPSLLGIVTDYHGGWIQCKKAREELGKDYPLKPVGTGPFAFDQYIPNQRAVFKAHEKYFRGKPKLKKVIVRYMPDLSSREMAFRKGKLNIIEGPREQQWIDKVKGFPETAIDVFGPGEHVTLHFNTAKKPFDDIRVRKAIACAIDRQGLIEFMGRDVAVPLYSPISMDYLGATEDVERYPHDPEKAKQLLADAGLKDGFTYEDVITEMAVYKRPMEAIQAQLRKYGINLKLRVVQHPAYHKLIRADTNHVVEYICARFPVADQLLTQFFHSASIVGKKTAITNFSHYDKVDDMLDKARVSTDINEQVALWQQVQQKILQDAIAYPLYTAKFVFARKSYVDYGYDLKSTLMLAPPVYYTTSVSK